MWTLNVRRIVSHLSDFVPILSINVKVAFLEDLEEHVLVVGPSRSEQSLVYDCKSDLTGYRWARHDALLLAPSEAIAETNKVIARISGKRTRRGRYGVCW